MRWLLVVVVLAVVGCSGDAFGEGTPVAAGADAGSDGSAGAGGGAGSGGAAGAAGSGGTGGTGGSAVVVCHFAMPAECPDGSTCQPDWKAYPSLGQVGPVGTCGPVGKAMPGGVCAGPHDCVAGSFCFKSAGVGTLSQCVRVCQDGGTLTPWGYSLCEP